MRIKKILIEDQTVATKKRRFGRLISFSHEQIQHYYIASFRAQERIEPTEEIEVEEKVSEHKLNPTAKEFQPRPTKQNHCNEQRSTRKGRST